VQCVLSKLAQETANADLEWWMHYQIPHDTTELYFSKNLTSKASGLPRSKTFPNMDPGIGLFTDVARKEGDKIACFPGCWMTTRMYEEMTPTSRKKHKDNYAFRLPEGGTRQWPYETELVYMTHQCQANYINAAVVKDEVHHQLCLTNTLSIYPNLEHKPYPPYACVCQPPSPTSIYILIIIPCRCWAK
jgi:hypothetical protein